MRRGNCRYKLYIWFFLFFIMVEEDAIKCIPEIVGEVRKTCFKLEKIPELQWIYFGNNFREPTSGKEILNRGSFRTVLEDVKYEVEKAHVSTSSYREGECPVFGDGGYTAYRHHFDFYLRIKAPDQKLISITDRFEHTPVSELYAKLNSAFCERERREEREAEEKLKIERERSAKRELERMKNVLGEINI